MNYRIVLWTLLTVFCLLLSGCGGSSARSDRRAQLVGHENLQLKKQLREKEKEIEHLKNQIKEMEQKAQEESAQQGQTYTKLLEIVADLSKQLEECKAGQTKPDNP